MSFTAFPLDTLGLTPAQLQLCTKANYLNAQDILLPAPSDLSRRLKIRLPDAQALVSAVSNAIVSRTSIVSDLVSCDESGDGVAVSTNALGKRKRRNGEYGVNEREGEGWIKTGDEGLDRLLGGGVRIGCVTEIVGESAAGKSHLTLHLALAAQLASLTSRPGGTIILTSERALSTTRLSQLEVKMREGHGQTMFLKRTTLSDGVLTRRVADVEQLEDVLSYGVPALLERGRGGKSASGKNGRLMGFTDDTAEENGAEGGSGPPTDWTKSMSNGNNVPTRLANTTLPNDHRHHPRAPVSRPSAPTPQPIRLLILDSLTALLRGAETSFTSSSAGLTARSRHLCSIGDKLKALAVEYELAVVVINQVSDVFDRRPIVKPIIDNDEPPLNGNFRHTQSQHPSSSQSLNLTHDQAWYAAGPDPPLLYNTQGRWFSGQASNGKKEAALGVVWANTINTRIMLSRTGRRRVVSPEELGEKENEVLSRRKEADGGVQPQVDPDGGGDGNQKMLVRRAHLIFSPFAPPATVDFVIRPSGISGLAGSFTLDEDGAKVLARVRKRMRVDGGEEEDDGNGETGEGEAAGDMEDDLFGPLDGLDDVPDDWWNGVVDSEAAAEKGGVQ